MIQFGVLILLTAVIAWLGFRIWKITRDVAFPVGIAILYYWSLLGSWFVIYDSLTNNGGKQFGLHYYYLLKKMFPVSADNTYLLTMLLLGLFVIGVEVTLLFFLKRKGAELPERSEYKAYKISHAAILAISLISLVLSFAIILPELKNAVQNNISIYSVTRASQSPYFMLHRLVNEIIIIPLFAGFVVYLGGKESVVVRGSEKKRWLYIYILVILLCEGYLFLLGNKNEMLFTGIFSFLFYLFNTQNNIRLKKVVLLILLFAAPLFFTDKVRALKPEQLIAWFDPSAVKEQEMVQTPDSPDSPGTIASFVFSNEMFCGNFSMYGVLTHDVPFTYGSSFVSLAASVVPRFLWPDRPREVYYHYAKSVGAQEGQGYSIHHATAWYINFGVPGILMGAFVLGWLWAFLYRKRTLIITGKRIWVRVFFITAFCALVAQMPNIIRSGPECYKPLIIEAFMIPLVCMLAAGMLVKKDKMA